MEEARLVKIKEVLKELPAPHYRTLEFLMRHLLHMASYSSQTNMHARNLAIVWAPNLLRSKDIEATGFNGTAAFMEVRVQSIVVEFILTHVEQLFGDAPLSGSEPKALRRSLLPGAGLPVPLPDGQPVPYHVPAVLNQGDGPPQIRPYHTIIEIGDHKRKGSLKAKKWKSIFNLGRSSHESKRKLVKPEEKEDKFGKISLRPAKSMDSLSSMPFASDVLFPFGSDVSQLSKKRSIKQPPQRRESFDTCSSPSQEKSFLELDESLEEKFKAKEEPQSLESEGESSTKSEPTTPKPGRASLVGAAASGRSPKAACNRAEKCAGVHISGPFSVTVPFHITSNLSRLTRGLECPALGQFREPAASPPASTCATVREPEAPKPQENPTVEAKADGPEDAEETRLSLELRDSFAFLDNQDSWLDYAGEGEPAARSLLGDTGLEDEESFPAIEDGMESGFMNPGESPVEQPASYLSIEECMDEEMFFMAPSGSDAEDSSKDTDSEDMFLSAHDDLSPLATELELHAEPAGQEMAVELPAPAEPGTTGTAGLQDAFPTPDVAGLRPTDEDAGGDGEHPGGLHGETAEWGAGESPEEEGQGGGSELKAPDGNAVPSRTDSSAERGPGDEAGQALGCAEAGPLPDAPDGEVEEDRAGCSPPAAEELETGKAQAWPSQRSPPATWLETFPLGSAARAEGTVAESIADASPLSASAPELREALPEVPTRGRPEPAPRPEPAAVLRRDGSAAVRLASRTVRVQQAKSVPVVPPKPQFAKIPPALKPKTPPAAGAARAGSEKRRSGSGCPEGSGRAARRAAWRNSGSVSFDAAVALAAERHAARTPVRRMQTYGGEEAPEPPSTSKPLPFHRAPAKPPGQRLLQSLSCAEGPDPPGEAPASAARQPEAKDGLSPPQAGAEEVGAARRGARASGTPSEG
ncbi:rho GTPase-activating protein 30 [Rhea pennata]|uniref:rho GTPase-activating protein 30 n=1 Tax=Rhea pennata TaxID=8795 RepID=UPI002E2590AC